MKIRSKITLFFSLTTLLVSGIAFVLIYLLFSANREEEFQMRQKQKVQMSLELLAQIKQTDDKLVEEMDLLTIHDLYDEKLLLFNRDKQLIYSSLDDTPIFFSEAILTQLTPQNKWVETKDDLYDVIGTYIESEDEIFYGISKAYDTFGYSKLRFLGYILITTFISLSVIVVCVSFYLSKKITEPLATVIQKINDYDFESDFSPVEISNSKDEVSLLAQQFNTLMERMNKVFSFQKHAVQHISHELKTPISVLVSNFEKIEQETDLKKIKDFLQHQKEDTKSLSEIINALLEFAKTETGTELKKDKIRIDELLFDLAEELRNIYPNFQFFMNYATPMTDENQLTVMANAQLIKAAFLNLMQNAIQYSDENTADITVDTQEDEIKIAFKNKGKTISEQEKQFMFQHFFRGENSQGKRGFGLGLVFVHKIISLHNGTISYCSPKKSVNVFTLTLKTSTGELH